MIEALAQRWLEALQWMPEVSAVRRASADCLAPVYRPQVNAPKKPPPDLEQALLVAYEAFDSLNRECFAAQCPPVFMLVNLRLRRTLGRIDPPGRLLELNESCLRGALPAIADLVHHEMTHLWLYATGQPCGHTAAFAAKVAERTPIYTAEQWRAFARYGERKVWYRCPGCGASFARRRRYARPMICAACHQAGRGNHRVQFLGIGQAAPH